MPSNHITNDLTALSGKCQALINHPYAISGPALPTQEAAILALDFLKQLLPAVDEILKGVAFEAGIDDPEKQRLASVMTEGDFFYWLERRGAGDKFE